MCAPAAPLSAQNYPPAASTRGAGEPEARWNPPRRPHSSPRARRPSWAPGAGRAGGRGPPGRLSLPGGARAAPAAVAPHQVQDLTAVRSPLVPATSSRECHGREAAPGEVSRRCRLTSPLQAPQQLGEAAGRRRERPWPAGAEDDVGRRHRSPSTAAMGRGRRRASTIRTWADRDVTMARPANRSPEAESSAMMSCGPGANRETIELS